LGEGRRVRGVEGLGRVRERRRGKGNDEKEYSKNGKKCNKNIL
jgi:hypothetical protein